MTSDQTYYLTIALINIILVFAGTRIEESASNKQSISFFIFSFSAYTLSWFLYCFDINIFIEVSSSIFATLFIWGMTIFSFKRCKVKVPVSLIIVLFFVHIIVQLFSTLEHNLHYILHTSGVFIPLAFCLCGWLHLKKKADITPSDSIVGYCFFLMAAVIITRSIILEALPEVFSVTSASTQLIWPVFSIALGVFSLVSYTEEAQKRLKLESITDPLTGLFNRRMFDQQLKRLLPSLSRNKHFGALIYLDLDGFKPVNDVYGHTAGDKLLIELGRRLNSSSRGGEIIARIGGDEFALLIEHAGQKRAAAHQRAEELAHRIQHLIKAPVTIENNQLQVGCSIGIHLISPETKDAELELKAADSAMYQAKNTQRGSIVFSSP